MVISQRKKKLYKTYKYSLRIQYIMYVDTHYTKKLHLNRKFSVILFSQ